MISIRFAKTRAEKTRDAQVNLSAPAPGGAGWVWSKKTVARWHTDCTLLDQLLADEIAKHTDLRNAATLLQANTDAIQRINRSVAALGKVHFADDANKQPLFARLRTHARGRTDIWEQGEAARCAWAKADATWVLDDPDQTELGPFGSLLASFLARKQTHGTALTDWRAAAAKLRNKATQVDRDNIHWYVAATRRFPANTVHGDTIRTVVPTTARPESPVGPAEISHLMVAGSDAHFDYTAAHGTLFTVLQQAPGSSVFLIVAAETEETSFTGHGLAVGLHRFKVYGSNSRGDGPASAVLEVTIAAPSATVSPGPPGASAAA